MKLAVEVPRVSRQQCGGRGGVGTGQGGAGAWAGTAAFTSAVRAGMGSEGSQQAMVTSHTGPGARAGMLGIPLDQDLDPSQRGTRRL